MTYPSQFYRNNALLGLASTISLILSFWVIRTVLNLESVFEPIQSAPPPPESRHPWMFMAWLWIYIPSFLLPLIFAHNTISLFIPPNAHFSRQIFLVLIQAAGVLGVVGTLLALTTGIYRDLEPLLSVIHPIRYVNYISYHLILSHVVGGFGLVTYQHRSLPRPLSGLALLVSILGCLLFIQGVAQGQGEALYLIVLIILNGAFVVVMAAYQALLWQSQLQLDSQSRTR
jgi:hypothetical protein